MNGGESGCNLLVWNRTYINQFYSQFPFRPIGSREEKAMEKYFLSDHFVKGLEYPTKPTTNHFHINVHSSVHPDAIQRYAEEALAREGISIYYTCPIVYLADGKNYRGKLVFMAAEPEVVFDIGWKFDPTTMIEPAMEPWIFDTHPGYDLWSSDMLAQVMNAYYVRLTDDEIQEVVKSCKIA